MYFEPIREFKKSFDNNSGSGHSINTDSTALSMKSRAKSSTKVVKIIKSPTLIKPMFGYVK